MSGPPKRLPLLFTAQKKQQSLLIALLGPLEVVEFLYRILLGTLHTLNQLFTNMQYRAHISKGLTCLMAER